MHLSLHRPLSLSLQLLTTHSGLLLGELLCLEATLSICLPWGRPPSMPDVGRTEAWFWGAINVPGEASLPRSPHVCTFPALSCILPSLLLRAPPDKLLGQKSLSWPLLLGNPTEDINLWSQCYPNLRTVAKRDVTRPCLSLVLYYL